jgi:AraC family transcriptional regulator
MKWNDWNAIVVQMNHHACKIISSTTKRSFDLFNKEHQPLENEIMNFVDNHLYDDLDDFLRQKYHVVPKSFYSACSMDEGYWKGWNVKYKKSGKSLCTVYPKEGFFTALIQVSEKDIAQDDVMTLLRDEYTRNVYQETKSGRNGKSLAIEVRSESILNDVKNLIALRV